MFLCAQPEYGEESAYKNKYTIYLHCQIRGANSHVTHLVSLQLVLAFLQYRREVRISTRETGYFLHSYQPKAPNLRFSYVQIHSHIIS